MAQACPSTVGNEQKQYKNLDTNISNMWGRLDQNPTTARNYSCFNCWETHLLALFISHLLKY